MSKTPSMREILADLKNEHVLEEWRGEWAMALLFRVPGQLLVWVFLRLGWSAVFVTTLGLVLSLLIPVGAVFLPLSMAVWVVFLLGAFCQVLDCADGTMARVGGQASVLGADLDYLFGMIHYLALYPAIGILADRVLETGALWTSLGAIAIAVRFLARLVREQVKKRIGEGPPAPFKLADLPGVFVAGLSGLIPFGAFAGPYASWVVIALLVYSALDTIEAFLEMTRPPYRT